MAGGARYETILRLASGGMATVWIGTVRGALGFRQLVAIKKPHPHLLSDPGFRGELIAEARLASMIRHANVVDVRDVEIEGDSISLVMDFIEGASLGDLLVTSSRLGTRLPARVAVRIIRDACAGLHAAHELVDERDRPIGLVHRDISPQNILIGTDGIARVTDFGVAKFARKNMQSTSEGSLKGKLAYMPPEYVRGETIDRRFDVFATGVVLWEALTGKRLFRGENEAETLRRLLDHTPEPVSSVFKELEPLDAVVTCALAKKLDERFQNAAAMGAALEAAANGAGLIGSHTEVAATLKELAGAAIDERRAAVRAKLANEPSVASLMGLPADAVPPAILLEPPATKPDAGPTLETPAFTKPSPPTTTKEADTPKMGGAPGNPVAAPALTAATLPVTSAVPSTQPMTPQMAGAPPQLSPNQTLASAPLLSPAPATAAPTTPVMSQPAFTLRSEDGSDPSLARSGVGLVTGPQQPPPAQPPPFAMADLHREVTADTGLATTQIPVELPPRRSLVPFFVGALVIVAGVVVLIVVARSKATKSDDATAATSASPSASVASSVSSATTATMTAGASSAASPATVVSASSARAAPAPPGQTRPTGRGPLPPPPPRTAPSPTAAPSPTTPTPTAPTPRTPPSNPY